MAALYPCPRRLSGLRSPKPLSHQKLTPGCYQTRRGAPSPPGGCCASRLMLGGMRVDAAAHAAESPALALSTAKLRKPPRDALTIDFVALAEALAKHRLLNPNHDEMCANSDGDRVECDPRAGHV